MTASILVVDDDESMRDLLRLHLTAAGYDVQVAADAITAGYMVLRSPPDLIISDVNMPHLDGFAILESLRAQDSEIFFPIIVLTADVNEETKRRALSAGATEFLVKPFDQLEVVLRIANSLETRRLHLLLDNQRAAFEEALRARSLELRAVQPNSLYIGV